MPVRAGIMASCPQSISATGRHSCRDRTRQGESRMKIGIAGTGRMGTRHRRPPDGSGARSARLEPVRRAKPSRSWSREPCPPRRRAELAGPLRCGAHHTDRRRRDRCGLQRKRRAALRRRSRQALHRDEHRFLGDRACAGACRRGQRRGAGRVPGRRQHRVRRAKASSSASWAGADADVARARPIVEQLCRRVEHVGRHRRGRGDEARDQSAARRVLADFRRGAVAGRSARPAAAAAGRYLRRHLGRPQHAEAARARTSRRR